MCPQLPGVSLRLTVSTSDWTAPASSYQVGSLAAQLEQRPSWPCDGSWTQWLLFFFISLSPGLLFSKWTWLSVLRLNGKCLEVHCLTIYWQGWQASKEWVCGKMPSRRQDVSPGMYTSWALETAQCPRRTVSTSALRHLSFLGGIDAASGLGSPVDTDDWSYHTWCQHTCL